MWDGAASGAPDATSNAARPSALGSAPTTLYLSDDDDDNDDSGWYDTPRPWAHADHSVDQRHMLVTANELTVLNVLSDNKLMPEEKKAGADETTASEPYVDPAKYPMKDYVITGFYGIDKLKSSLCKHKLTEACRDLNADKKRVASLIHAIRTNNTGTHTKDKKTGVYLALRIDDESMARMTTDSHNFVAKFAYVDDDMDGVTKAVSYAIKRFVHGDGLTEGFKFVDGADAAAAKLEALDRALARAGERSEPAKYESANEYLFAQAEQARLDELKSGDEPSYAMPSADDEAFKWGDRAAEALLDVEPTDEANELHIGYNFDEEYRMGTTMGGSTKVSRTAKAPRVQARAGPCIKFLCSCTNCKAPTNLDLDEAEADEPPLADANVGELSAEEALAKEVMAYASSADADLGFAFDQSQLDALKAQVAPTLVEEVQLNEDGDVPEDLSERSKNSHDVATPYDAALAQGRLYRYLKATKPNDPPPDGYHPVCLMKIIGALLRAGLESELTKRLVCCSDIACLERMGMRRPGWHTRFQCAEQARHHLHRLQRLGAESKTAYWLRNGSKRHAQQEGVLDNMKALRHYRAYLVEEQAVHALTDVDVDVMTGYINMYCQWTQEQEKKYATAALAMANNQEAHKLTISDPQRLVDSVHCAAFLYLQRVVARWVKDKQPEYVIRKSAHTMVLRKLFDDAHPTNFEATFLAMKMSLIDSIGLSEYNETTGIPKHRVPWWCERPQTELYLENAGTYSLVSGQSFVPRTQPTRLMRLPGDVVMNFDQFKAQKLEYSSGLDKKLSLVPDVTPQKYTTVEAAEEERRLRHGRLPLMLTPEGCSRGGLWADPLSTDAFRAAWDKVSNKTTVEETFEYNRGVEVMSDESAAIRSVLKGGSKPNDWRVQLVKRSQQNGMTGSRREVTKCKLDYTRGGIYVLDGVSELDKNVHSRSRLINGLVALGYTASFKDFDLLLKEEADKYAKLADDAAKTEADVRFKWSFVLEHSVKLPTKRTACTPDGSFACEVPYDINLSLYHALVDATLALDRTTRFAHSGVGFGGTAAQRRAEAVRCNDDCWARVADANREYSQKRDEIVQKLRDERKRYKLQVDVMLKRYKDPIEQSELERAHMEAFDAKQRQALLDDDGASQTGLWWKSDVGEARANGVKGAREASQKYIEERRLGAEKGALGGAELALLQKVASALADDLKLAPREGGCRCLRSDDVCAVLVRLEPEDPSVRGSRLVHRPVNVNEALRRAEAYAALPEEDRTRPMWENHNVLFNCKVVFESPADVAAAYDAHTAPAWPPQAVVVNGLRAVVKGVINDIVENNDSMRRSLPTKTLSMHKRRQLAAINSVRLAPVVADSMLMFNPSGHIGIKTQASADGAVNKFVRFRKAVERMELAGAGRESLADFVRGVPDAACRGHKACFGPKLLWDNSGRKPKSGELGEANGVNPLRAEFPVPTLAGCGPASAHARDTRLQAVKDCSYGTPGGLFFGAFRNGDAAAPPDVGAGLRDTAKYYSRMSDAVESLEKMIEAGKDADWLYGILDDAHNNGAWSPLPNPGEPPGVLPLRKAKLFELQEVLELVADMLNEPRPADVRPGSHGERYYLDLAKHMGVLLEAHNPFSTPHESSTIHTWHAPVQDKGTGCFGRQELPDGTRPKLSPWALHSVRDDVALAMRLGRGAPMMRAFVDSVLTAQGVLSNGERRERRRDQVHLRQRCRAQAEQNLDEDMSEAELDADDGDDADEREERARAREERARARALVAEGRKQRELALGRTLEWLEELEIATPANKAAAATLGAHRELLSRDIGAARLRKAFAGGDRVPTGPYAGFKHHEVAKMKALVAAREEGTPDIFAPHPFGIDVDNMPAVFHAKLDWARTRTAMAQLLCDSERVAHDLEMALIKGQITEGQKELHKRNQEQLERHLAWRKTVQDNHNRGTATSQANGCGAGRKNHKALMRSAARRPGGERGRLEGERDVLLSSIKEGNPAQLADLRAQLAAVEASIASLSKPKEPAKLLNQQLVAKLVKGRYEWPFQHLCDANDLDEPERKRVQDACAAGGMVTITEPMVQSLVRASEARYASAVEQCKRETGFCKDFVLNCANGMHDLTPEGAQKRRAADPADPEGMPEPKRPLSARGCAPTFEEYLNDRLGGSARMHNLKQQEGRQLLVAGRDERQLSWWDRARIKSDGLVSENLQKQVHAFHGADASSGDEEAAAKWSAYNERLAVKSWELGAWNSAAKGLS